MKTGKAMVLGLALAAVALFAPGQAGAVDSDLKYSYAFTVEATNGYSILAYAGNERADGQGQVVLFVQSKNAGAVYVAPAQLTATGLSADLGPLGSVALEVIPTGRDRTIKNCHDPGEPVSFEAQRYAGSFEFHGEQGYTDAVTDAPREYTRLFLGLGCGTSGSLQVGGDEIPGAGLRLHSPAGKRNLDLTAHKNGPNKRVHLEVSVREKRRGISISRFIARWAGPSAFEFDPLLRSATLAPPAPFSGTAVFDRSATGPGRWRGNLTVDMPGRSRMPLTGSGVKAALVPGCWAVDPARGVNC